MTISLAERARRMAAGVAAGAAAVLLVHQPLLWLLYGGGMVPWPGFATDPTPPFGVPRFLSAVFWGAAWGGVLRPWLPARGAARWRRAALLGALPTTLVGSVLTLLGRAFPRPEHPLGALLAALAVNAAWGVAWAALQRAPDA
jgi:hypothetical protein